MSPFVSIQKISHPVYIHVHVCVDTYVMYVYMNIKPGIRRKGKSGYFWEGAGLGREPTLCLSSFVTTIHV
jgi:hypothetical protein